MSPTAEEIANEIHMRCVDTPGPFILVEGPSDVRFLSCQMTVGIENIVPTFGWERLVDAMVILQGDGLVNILGIIDLDYRGIIASTELPTDVFTADSHDMETMMFSSSAFEKVLGQKSSLRKVRTYPSGSAGVKSKVLDLGQRIGSLRFYSQFIEEHYSFEDLDIGKFVDRRTLVLSDPQCVSHIRGISPKNSRIPNDILARALAETLNVPEFADTYRLCCGHDLMEILAIGLKSLWGSHSSTEISGDLIEESFRLAYSHEMFCITNLFRQINDWFHSRGYDDPWG
ncbi:DUF4435 domain-containing protein [Candidatus Bathyarchaeota archaeon]|nr:DUF4435 domain-containing protein [Candidatus Bathyarchaeota archaeon]